MSYLFMALCLFLLVLTLTVKKDSDGAATVFGRQMRIVLSSSMEKCDQTDVSAYEIKDIPVKSVVFVQTVPQDDAEAAEWYKNLKVGDVLTFRYLYAKQETITHRISAISENNSGGYTVTLEGDNKASDAGVIKQVINTADQNSPNHIIGKVTATSHALGVALTAVKSPLGMVLIIIVPCFVIALLEIVKIVDIFVGNKKEKALAKQKETESQLIELKQQLEELRAKQTAADATALNEETKNYQGEA